MGKSSLMSYNTFTFKTEAQMLLHIRLWEDKGKFCMKSSKKKDVHDIAIIRYGIRRELIRLQLYLNIKALKPTRIAKKLLIHSDKA